MMSFISPLKKLIKNPLLLIIVAAFVFSAVLYALHFRGQRYSFVYHIAGSSEEVFETRSVPSVNGTSKIQLYVEELLLGPSVPRGAPLFPLETRVLFCFLRDGELFVNLSQDAVLDLSASADFNESRDLMEKNIIDNFPLVKKLNLFVEGNSVDGDELSGGKIE